MAYFLGIDVGTQGARVILLDNGGELKATAEKVFPLDDQSREEQSPLVWWDACYCCLKEIIGDLTRAEREEIIAVSVTSTSGTVIPIDKYNNPLHNALMYSDKRSEKQAIKCTEAANTHHKFGNTAYNSSSGLAKMVWFVETYPAKAECIYKWIHATDFIIGKLSDVWAVTDYTNAFKSGYDVSNFLWPEYLYTHLPLKKEWLPEVVGSGTVIGDLSTDLAKEFDLPAGIRVAAGMTDGCASQIASGAVNPGDWNTTIGTTMVIKGVTKKEVLDPLGRLYSHRHPEGYWMPGGASNTGADWITSEFSTNLTELNAAAAQIFPTKHIVYPLRQNGERFPIIAPQARGFKPEGLSSAEEYTAGMEGVAYLERYAYELIEYLADEKVAIVFTAGGGSNSGVWLTIRASVLNRPIYKMKYVSGAVGAAILAASKTAFKTIQEATSALTIVEKLVMPEDRLVSMYEKTYCEFLASMINKGYIKGGFDA